MIENIEELLRKLAKMGGDIPKVMLNTIGKQSEFVKENAQALAPVNHGELKEKIFSMVEQKGSTTTGTTYTNVGHAVFVEMGTGPKGEENHSGISPNVSPIYTQDGWWFPADAIDPSDAERYRFVESSGEDGTFYYTRGQKAQPFMYPALKESEEQIVKNIADDIRSEIEKIANS